MEKLFTKSVFKLALDCPRKIYYYRNKDKYFNADDNNDFLSSLADGGFQVGELAKIYCEVPKENDLQDLKGYDDSLQRTKELMEQNEVNIAEAAFKYNNMFVRVDVLRRSGNYIQLIEVKAKSWDTEEESFENKKGAVQSGIRPYVYDVAFQKYVVENALRDEYPETSFVVEAFLMMADKSKVTDIDGLNQMFKIQKKGDRTVILTAPDAKERIEQSKVKVLTPFEVDDLCRHIIAGETAEQDLEGAWMQGMKFKEFAEEMARLYCANIPCSDTSLHIGTSCFGCGFHVPHGTDTTLSDGYKECWMCGAPHLTEADFSKPLVKDLWGGGNSKTRGQLLAAGIYRMEDITEDIMPRQTSKPVKGLDYNQRKWLQVGMTLADEKILQEFAQNIHPNGAYVDIEGLREEMREWKFPLHMIDFETTTVALPYYKGMRPYEAVAFQFSHHTIYDNGDGTYRVEHTGQYLNEDVMAFPNFEFARELKTQLEKDNGTIFRYSNHENTILRHIYDQLDESNESDKVELMAWIDTITHVKKNQKLLHQGERDMVDLWEVVKSYFYEPKEMVGSNSIKVVLPAVLNTSDFLKEKYLRPIYGSEIRSCNILAEAPISWIDADDFHKTGHVESPYHLLPAVGDLLDLDKDETEWMMKKENSAEEDFQVANGGAALTAYSKLMFCEGVMTSALREALLRYCELDTMSMVFIWEYFNDMVGGLKCMHSN